MIMVAPESTSPVNPAAPGRESRSALRKAVKLKARLRDRGATRFDITVLDLSLAGFRAETAYRLNPGQLVWISLPGLAGIEAIVAWQERQFVGCQFSTPLHAAVFDHICRLGTS